MKHLYLIGGPMGVGKTTVSRALQQRLPNCAFLDGDWCWDMRPFYVTDETKAMVLDNICHLLSSFLRCSVYDNVVFCWVLHQQAILDELLSRLPLEGVEVHAISLVASPEALTARLKKDIDAGLRQPDVIHRSLRYLPLYEELDTHKLDTTALTAEEAAARLSVGFRPAEAGDAPVIARLRQEIWSTTYRGIYPDEMIDDFQMEWHTHRNLEWIRSWSTYLIEAAGEPIGYLIFREGDPLYLQSLYVRQDWQRMGIGKLAFDLVRQRCREQGIMTIRFQCSPWNENAIACCLHMGAIITGRDEGHENKAEDTLWLELPVE